jgi:polysaccharide export outer membrane protein
MMTKRPGKTGAWVAGAALLLALDCGFAQAQAGDPGNPALKQNPLAGLRAFEPDANQEYQLGRGDEISVDVNGRPEISRKYVLGPDGRITLPLAGPVLLADKTREQAAEAIEQALGAYYNQVSATVSIDKYTSNHVLLLGAVEHPGLMNFDRAPTLLEVISRGGIVPGTLTPTPSNSGGKYVAAATPSMFPERVAIYRGSDEALWVDLKGLLNSGSGLADLRLKRDDVVYVPSPSDRYISVLGQVQHPGAIQMDSTTSLQKLLAEAGGLTELAGSNPKIQIIQASTGKTRVVSFSAVLSPAALDLTLHSGDIVYIPESGFNRATYVLQRLSPLVTLFASAAILGQ